MRQRLLAVLVYVSWTATLHAADAASARTVQLDGLSLRLAAPVLVAKSKGYLWYPVVHRLSDGGLVAVLNNYPDLAHSKPTAQLCWSTDEGRHWSRMQPGIFGGVGVPLTEGDLLLVPHWLLSRPNEEFGEVVRIPKGKQQAVPGGEFTVSGFPRSFQTHRPALGPHSDVGSFHITGRVLPLPDGGYLGMMTGRWEGAGEELRLIAIHSTDGRNWKYRSTIASREWKLSAGGPNEGALARLKDGRLLCVFRHSVPVPFGHCFSTDNGRTWTEPELMPDDVCSVKPCLSVLEGGVLALSGGRPGIHVWFNTEGDARKWQSIDLIAHHNAATAPADALGKPTGYVDLVALDSRTLLAIYDSRARDWDSHLGHIVPEDSNEFNRVWVVRMEIER